MSKMTEEIIKARPIWQELPEHFKINIVELLNFESRCNLRLSSQADKETVDKTNIEIESLTLNCERDFQVQMRIKLPSEGPIRFHQDFFDFSKPLLKIFHNPVMKIGRLELEFILIPEVLLALGRAKLTNIKIETLYVKHLVRGDSQNIVNDSFLEFLERFHLKKMAFDGRFTPKSFENLMATRQWKMAEGIHFVHTNDFEIRLFLRFNSLRLWRKRLEPEEAKELIKSFTNKESFGHATTFFQIACEETIQTDMILHTSNIFLKENITLRVENEYDKIRVEKFEMVNSDNLVLLVKATPKTLIGVVCRKLPYTFQDFKNTPFI